MSDIDPVRFGLLTGQVKVLEDQVSELQKDVKLLLKLANRSAGGLLVGMTCASTIGAILSWVVSHMRFS